MRSQQEILEKIDGIAKNLFKLDPKKDPFYQQYKVFVHKLSWKNAQQFLKPEDCTPERQVEWEKLNRMDKEVLVAEIKAQCDIGAMHVTGQDPEYAMYCASGLIAMFWMLGPNREDTLRNIFHDFLQERTAVLCFEPVFQAVCNELGFDWERMKSCYERGMFSRLEDKFGRHFRLKQDAEIAKAIDETVQEKSDGKLAIEKDKEERQK